MLRHSTFTSGSSTPPHSSLTPGYSLWQLDDTNGGPSQSVINTGKVPIMYTKVAIAMNALFGTPYTQTLVNAVLPKVESSYGFREAIRESDGGIIGTTTWPIQDKTQSFALAAARYALSNPSGSLHRHHIPHIPVQMTWNRQIPTQLTSLFSTVCHSQFKV